MSYRLSLPAYNDLKSIYRRGLDVFGEQQASRYYAALLDTLSFLADFPHVARERVEISPAVRVHRYQAHVIVYVIAGSGVAILRIRHGHEDWSTNPLG